MVTADSRRWLLRGTVLALALAVGLVAWLSERGADGAAVEPSPEVRIVRPVALADAAVLSGHPVYWIGPVPGTELELSEAADGTVQVRYLPVGSQSGEERPGGVLTVASYPLAHPARALSAFAARPGSSVHGARAGRKVVTSAESPGSAYFASPDDSVQVEVYDPAPNRALGLVLSGRVRPAG
jgi:hypothetical protein